MSITREEYKDAMEARARMQLLYAQTWEKYDIAAVIFPTTPLPPRPIGQEETVELNGKQVPTFSTYVRNTGPGSVAGVPGLSLPMGLTKSGLPVGLEVDGPAWRDRELLGVALVIEKVLPSIPMPVLGKKK
jgi:mandelamide amidase